MANLNPDLAARLRDAYRSGPVSPMRDGLAPHDVDGAYAIQAANTRRWLDDGRRIVGRKIGLTSVAVQAQLGVDQPDFGVLFDDMRIEDGGWLDPARVIQPKVEAEVALVLGRDIADPAATPEIVRDAVAYVVAALEVVDSRIADWAITFADTVADNGSSAFFVLGGERRLLDGLDLYSCGMVLERNGKVASVGSGAACLGHPLNAAAWLVRAITAFGETLHAGDVILTGALGPMVPLASGDKVRCVIGGLGECQMTYGEVTA